jgi:hypothetical protein
MFAAAFTADHTPMTELNAAALAQSAYAKAAARYELNDAERGAVAAAAGQPGPAILAASDLALGFLYLHSPELIRRLDALVAEASGVLGLAEYVAWRAVGQYAQLALLVAMDEAGLGEDDASASSKTDMQVTTYKLGGYIVRADPDNFALMRADGSPVAGASVVYRDADDGSPLVIFGDGERAAELAQPLTTDADGRIPLVSFDLVPAAEIAVSVSGEDLLVIAMVGAAA